MTRRILLALALVGTFSTIGCGRDDQAIEGTTSAAGKVGSYYYVSMTVPPLGGYVRSSNGALLCGASARTVVNSQYVYTYYTTPYGVANKCTQAKVTWGQSVVLTATAQGTNAFLGWAGDCGGTGTCTLSSGADKSVGATFGPSGSAHPNYSSNAVHGPAYYAFLNGTPGALACTSCHGPTLTGQGIAPSCNTCHQADGWIGWQTNCSFCHGATTAAAKAGYTFSAHPEWAAPPTTAGQRDGAAADLTRTGAHQAHLTGVTPSGLAVGAFACATCHVVPTTLSHVNGSSARGAVALSGAGQSSLPTLLGTYDQASGTCTTYCHGSSPSPAWSATGMACSGCHGLPPTSLHPAITGGLTTCTLCHPDSVNADGTIKAGGKHLDGTVQAIGGHLAGYAAPAVHGPDALAGLDTCRGCHGTTLDGNMGPSCNACHLANGWTGNWQTNCSFCHGARTASTRAGYSVASNPGWSAPPDAVLQRLGGAAEPDRTGAHQIHLAGSAMAGAFKCETCHTVPTGLAHFAGSTTRATVILSGAGQASLPSNLGTYDQTSGRCATACHGTAASPAWSAAGGVVCGTCHALPPAPATGHPTVPSDLTTCSICHTTTMTAAGTINLASGNHVNGVVNVEGGHPNWSSPATHGPIYFDYLNGGATLDCKVCHGATLGGGVGPACASCHAAAGWTNWQSNCSFCHGTKSAATQAGYSVAANPTWSAPPDAIAQRLGGASAPARTGAHQAHLSNGAFTAAFACSTCHAVPSDLSHIGPSGNRATVALSGAGQRSLPASLGSYDPATGTCATSCHGPAGSPAWSSPAPMVCGGCHALPPAPATGHPNVSSSLPGCNVCHPDTVRADGTLDLAGGKHLDGVIESSGMHGNYASPATHGPAFFNFLSGASTLDCKRCHGATYDGGVGPSCNNCHAAAGWTGWQSNCSFCHGAKTTASQGGYALASHPGWSAPPDALAQRLDPAHAAVPERTGAHQIHLAGSSLGPAFTCATCHPVPSDLSHIEGAGVRAKVVLSPAGQFSLPANMGSYDQASGSCTTYCHGSSGSPAWSSPPGGAYCGYCHGLPPSAAVGHPNVPANLNYCYICHPTSINPDGTHKDGGTHLNGVKDASGMHGDYSSPATHGPRFFDYLNGVGTLDCRSCHGATLDGGTVGPSCTACHVANGWTGWQSNCSFCHGARTASTKAGYSVTSNPGWSAPPDAISQRLTGTAAPARTGAHQIHLSGGPLAGGFACATCHPVPSDLSHIGPDGNRANVVLSPAGQAQLPAAMGAYSQASGTCATYCHGNGVTSGSSPAWSAGAIACDGCHGLPPTTPGHPVVTGGVTKCAGCHPDTVNADGTINVAGGKHLNGHVEAQGHADWTLPTAHAPQFYAFLRGDTGAFQCTGCHGADYGGSSAPSCTACHISAGWQGWTTNCSFCHGAKTTAAKAGYLMSAHAEWAAPPDAVQQRLTGVAAPARTGAHQAHMTGKGSVSGGSYVVPALPCATCHTVPTTLAHSAPFGRAPVVLRGYGALPLNLGSYNPATGTCTTYCHGTTLVSGTGAPIPAPVWTGSELGCAGCHGAPPATGQHDFHVNGMGYSCADCHAATVDFPTVPGSSGTIFGAHLDGAIQVQFYGDTTWDGNNCTSACHGGETYSWQ